MSLSAVLYKMNNVCEQELESLRCAVREHVREMDGIMKGPASFEHGQQIARSVSTLERALSGSALPVPVPAPASPPSTSLAKPLSPVASGPRPKRRKRA